MEDMLLEFAKTGLSEAMKNGIGEKVILFLIAWRMVKKSMQEEIKKITDGVKGVADNVRDLKDEMTKVELTHSSRIGNLETSFRTLNEEVQILKTKE